MEANKMFEELGFIREEEEKTCMLYKNTWQPETLVSFYLENKRYSVSEYEYMSGEYTWKSITIALHKAITQQLKELGWLND